MAGLQAASRLLLHHQQFLVGRRPSVIRMFSSSSNDETPKSLEKGYKLATGLWRRYTLRLQELKEYQDKKVFVDSLSTFAQLWRFVQLQLPEKTHTNLFDFVSGASMASEATLRAINSRAYPEFLVGKENSSSEVADKLKEYMIPACYNQTALQVKKNYLHRNCYVECEEMQIEKTQLAHATYHRLTKQEYQDWVNFKKPQKGAISPKASIEFLRLSVDVAAVEDLKIVHLVEKTRYIQYQNVYRVVFGSIVTDPDTVDWRIENMRIIEQKAISR
ncbi:unnamed protein product [Peronospora destructor]|uniref:Tim44-like domain-containing protein n=1 Tax=Peronospora destructor TaxID=86335 RepID=A0AAV0UZQ2_9STRA|nr:unnamed protein product [Peronospora destructor]